MFLCFLQLAPKPCTRGQRLGRAGKEIGRYVTNAAEDGNTTGEEGKPQFVAGRRGNEETSCWTRQYVCPGP